MYAYRLHSLCLTDMILDGTQKKKKRNFKNQKKIKNIQKY